MEKAKREGRAEPSEPATNPPQNLSSKTSSATETRLRVRSPSGVWIGTMSVDATLGDVETAMMRDGKVTGAAPLTVCLTIH